MKMSKFAEWRVILLSGIMVHFFLSQASAEIPRQTERARQIRQQLAMQLEPRVVSPAQLEPYREQLLLAVDALSAFLDTADPEVAEGWRNYLQWDALLNELAAEQSDLEVLSEVLISFRRYHQGIELDPFQKLQQTLQAYVHEAEIVGAMKAEGQFDHCLSQLASALSRHEIRPNYEDAHIIGRELYCLEKSIESGHAAIDQIRDRFRHPNLYGKVELALINRMIERDLEQATTIYEVSDRRTTRGQANTFAHVKAVLQPDPKQASVDLVLKGTCRAPTTITEQGQIRVRGSFQTEIEASKRMLVDKEGIRFLPAQVQCSTDVAFHNISADRPVVERIARRRAPRMRPEAEDDVSRQTEQRIAQELDTQASQALQEANRMFTDYFCAPNRCYGTFPELLRFSTLPDKLQVHMRSARPWQLGAPEPPPAVPENDFGFALHESVIGNYSEGLFGGKEITDRQWLSCLNTLTGSEPRVLWVHDRTERWSVTFANQRPIVVSFCDDMIGFTLRMKRFHRGEEQLDSMIDIKSAFHVETTRDGPVFFRQGDVTVQLVEDRPATTEEQQALDFLHRKFSAVMPEELYFDGLVPPAGGSLAMMRKFCPDAFRIDKGWLRLGYSMVDEKADES